MGHHKINLSTVFAGQQIGIREVADQTCVAYEMSCSCWVAVLRTIAFLVFEGVLVIVAAVTAVTQVYRTCTGACRYYNERKRN